MEAANVIPLLEQLDDDIDDLEEALRPILKRGLAETSKKLPVLDKAKLHVWLTYALESLIFSYIRLHGVNAREHRVFRELSRMKQYFEKIDALEKGPEQRTMTLDKEAAGRFIKHGLVGNDKFDLERQEQQAKEKARAHLKASILAKKAENVETAEQSNERPRADEDSTDDDSDDEETTGVESMRASKPAMTNPEKSDKNKKNKEKKKQKKGKKDKKEQQKEKSERRQKKKEARKARGAK